MKGSESCIGCKSETSIINFHSQGKTFSRFYNNIDSRFEFKHVKYVETGSILRNGLSHKQILVKMRGLILEASTSPRKLSVSFNRNSTSSTTEIAPANAQPTLEMSRQCRVVSGALNFSEELKQSNCGKVML